MLFSASPAHRGRCSADVCSLSAPFLLFCMTKLHIPPGKSAISAAFRLDVIKFRVEGGKRLKPAGDRKERLQKRKKKKKTADQVKVRSVI